MKTIQQNRTAEWSFTAENVYPDPFQAVEVSVIFQHAESGAEQRVPAFWAGGQVWRVRFSSPQTGTYTFRSECSNPTDSGLHGQEGTLRVIAYNGKNPLYRHGPVQVAGDGRHFAHADGTPFFWLGDTWWMGLSQRLEWPRGFRALTRDRVQKGFTVIQIVAGLYPDMPAFDPRGANEAGFPWSAGFESINPAYFDAADRRIEHLVASGLLPCVLGCWGYYLQWLGEAKMKQHWRYLVARYGSYPVMWCLAGEGTMPYYLSSTPEEDARALKTGWTELAAYVHRIDPYGRMVTIHPSTSARACVEDASVLDFEMLQTGHSDRASLPHTLKWVRAAYQAQPAMPVVQSEVCYEGIGAFCEASLQRWLFWACMLNGAAGFTYGANGIWQVNSRQQPYGPSPHGMTWGNTPWEDASQLPGSAHLGAGKRFLENLPFQQLEPHPEWVEPGWHADLDNLPFTCGTHDIPLCAGIPGKLHLIYIPMGTGLRLVKGLTPGGAYHLSLLDPLSGAETSVGPVTSGEDGSWVPHIPGTPAWFKRPVFQDWVYVLRAVGPE